MALLKQYERSSRYAAAAIGTLFSVLLFLENGLPLASAAEPVKAAADEPLILKPGQELPKGKWVDVMTPVDPDWDTVNGAWHRGAWDGLSGTWRSQGSELTPERSCFQRLMLPVKLEGSYDLKIEFTRRSDNSSVDILFPVGSRTCMLALASESQSAHVLRIIDGKKPADATTLRFGGQVTL